MVAKDLDQLIIKLINAKKMLEIIESNYYSFDTAAPLIKIEEDVKAVKAQIDAITTKLG